MLSGQLLPHTRYEGIVDTIVQLLCSPHLWPNRNRSRRTLIGPRKDRA